MSETVTIMTQNSPSPCDHEYTMSNILRIRTARATSSTADAVGTESTSLEEVHGARSEEKKGHRQDD